MTTITCSFPNIFEVGLITEMLKCEVSHLALLTMLHICFQVLERSQSVVWRLVV